MLRLLPNPNDAKRNTERQPSARPSALVYTLLRHGRNLPRAEAERRLGESLGTLDGAPKTFDGPFQAA